VLNWSIKSKLSEKRFKNIVGNLNQFNCPKALIHTVLERNDIKKFEDKGIITLKIGYQLLPRYFYEFFSKKGQTRMRKVDSRKTKEDLEEKIQTLLHRALIQAIESEINKFCV